MSHIIFIAHLELDKQTKNRNETGSNLSLGTRLTVLSKRFGRKRYNDTTPDRRLEEAWFFVRGAPILGRPSEGRPNR